MQALDYSPLPRAGRRLSTGLAPHGRRRNTLSLRVVRAWFHFSGSIDSLILMRPGEGYLFFLLMLSNMSFFLSWTLKAVIVPEQGGVALISTRVGLLALASIFVRTGLMYLLAMLAGAISRLLGGRGTWRNTRIALFWADLVSAPIGVAAAVLSIVFSYLAIDFPIFASPWIAMPPYWFGSLPLIWFMSLGVARVHGFSKRSPVFLILSIVSLVALVGGMYFHAKGMI
ncbi:MAG: hypothetical protein ACE5DK_05015 [Paracoccaceae bacterium]